MNRDFAEMLSELNRHGVRFLVVGSYATAFHGYTRATKDLDLWVDSDEENGRRLKAALTAFGAPGEHLRDFEDFLASEDILQIGVAPNRIDLLTALPGVEFEPCWSRRVESKYGEVPVFVISLGDHKANKRATGRPQDLLDIENLPDD